MQPISIVEKEGFRDFIEFLEPSFSIPTRYRVKESGLPNLKVLVENKIKQELAQLNSINISLDGWSDAIMRSFNGYIAQGI